MDRDRELSKAKLRDVVIGSAIAATLVALMPTEQSQRDVTLAGTLIARPRAPKAILPKPKPDCAKANARRDSAQPCDQHASRAIQHKLSEYHEMLAPDVGHRVDIRI
jgi:hypothetical protein